MKTTMFAIAIAILIGMTMTVPAWAQESQSTNFGNETTTQRPRYFNPEKVETISGKIIRVDQFASQGQRYGTGMHLSVETAQETIDVHLGPSWYLDEQKFSLKSGDQVEVTGSRITEASKPTLIAVEVKSGDSVLPLRDKDGLPAWRGMGRGGMDRGQRRRAQ